MEISHTKLTGLNRSLQLPAGAAEAIEAAFSGKTPSAFESSLLATLRATQRAGHPFLRGKLIYLLLQARKLAQQQEKMDLLGSLEDLLAGLTEAHGDVHNATSADLWWWLGIWKQEGSHEIVPPLPPPTTAAPAPTGGCSAQAPPPPKSTEQEQEELRAAILAAVVDDYAGEGGEPGASRSNQAAATQAEVGDNYAGLTPADWLALEELMKKIEVTISPDFNFIFITARGIHKSLKHVSHMKAVKLCCGPTVTQVLTVLHTMTEALEGRAQARVETGKPDALTTEITFTAEEEAWLGQIAELSGKVVLTPPTTDVGDPSAPTASCSAAASQAEPPAGNKASQLLAKLKGLMKTRK